MGQRMHKGLQRARRQLRRVYRSLFFPPFVIFVAMMFVTYWSHRASVLSIQRDQSIAISARQENVSSTIGQRLKTYEEILIGGAGLFRASRDVTEQEWHNYISTFDVTNRYPGVQSLGYIRVVNAAQLPELESSMKAQGFADFKITPDTPRDLYTAVIYNEPDRQTTGRGQDLFTQTDRRAVMERARDSGNATITKPLTALQNVSDQLVFIMFAPQYAPDMPTTTIAEREKALRGYIYAGFRSQDFFNKLLPISAADTDVALSVSAKNTDMASFYQSPNYTTMSRAKGTVNSSQTLDMYGTSWVINYVFNGDDLSNSQRRNTPVWIVVLGSLFAILLAEVIYLLLKTRARELASQRDRAVDLAKDELLSLASHQLRTPATTVKQYLGMVLQGFAGDVAKNQKKLLQKAYTGNERQLRIINEMLHVAKVDSGRITLAMQHADLGKLLKEVVADALPEAKKVDHTIKLNLPKQPIIMNVDEHMLRMAIENIVNNAIKYTLPKGRIGISLRQKDGLVYITVRDSGVGISSRDFPKLYKLFTRLNHKLTQSVSGTGVGLYLAKHLVELHDGTITVSSKLDKGSTFTIILPYYPVKNDS